MTKVFSTLLVCCLLYNVPLHARFQQDPLANNNKRKIVSGTVTDAEAKTPLVGASVQIKNTVQGTTTDATGHFSLPVEGDGATLVVSYSGLATQEIVVKNQAALNIQLQKKGNDLNEVVVVGYGTQRKGD